MLSLGGKLFYVVAHGFEIRRAFDPGVDRKPPVAKHFERLPLGLGCHGAIEQSYLITEEPQRPCGGHSRILLPKASRRAIARVHHGTLASRFGLGVEGEEVFLAQIDFTAYLEEPWQITSQPLGHILDFAHIGGNVLAGVSVASRRAANQSAIFVHETQRHAIDLWLAGQFDFTGDPEPFLAAPVPAIKFVIIRCLAKREHGWLVGNFGEGLGRRASDAQGGRVRCGELRVLAL